MKRLAAIALAFMVACSGVDTSPEDVYVEWGFSQTPEGKLVNVVNGLSNAEESVIMLFDTFDDILGNGCDSYDPDSPHKAVLNGQTTEKRAVEKIRQLADEAFRNLPENFSCPVDYYFSVRIGFGKSESDRTVWSIRFPY